VRTAIKLVLTLVIGTLGVIGAVIALAPAAHALFTAGTASGGNDLISLAPLPETSNVYDDQGHLIAQFHADQNRFPVTYNEVPKGVIEAVVDTEDSHFWYHHGIDIWSTLRALFSNGKAGSVLQGGSTITQQLVKNTILTDQRTLTRKLKEAVLAVRLEDQLTKQQIMERYLNTVYFGNGAYGIGAAAQTYFNEPVEKLTRVQGALLAGLIQDPNGYDPIAHPDLARDRRNFVLGRMVANGDMTRAEADGAVDAPIPTQVTASQAPPLNPQIGYFVEEVKQRLLEDPDLGSTAQARYNAVFNGGLKIYTTLDPKMEQDAEQAVADHLPSEGGEWTAVLVSVDSTTGAVRALVGGPGYNLSQYRIATEGPGRQPGSSFKPIVLAAALKEGYSVNAGVDGNTPCTFKNPGSAPYTAHNDEGGASGYMNLAYALAESVNCAYLRLGLDVGLDKVVDMAQELGVTTPLEPYLSMSIGSEEVRPIDMAGVYDTFADNGVHHTPYLVQKIVDRNGNTILTGGNPGVQVLSPQKAHEEDIALRDVVTEGTAAGEDLNGRPGYGKTGTAENYDNAWFDGFTPQLTTVVWMGSPIGNVPMDDVCGKTLTANFVCPGVVFGATIPAPIWKEYMDLALAGQPSMTIPPPSYDDMGDIYSVKDPPGSYSDYTSTPGSSGYSSPTTTYAPYGSGTGGESPGSKSPTGSTGGGASGTSGTGPGTSGSGGGSGSAPAGGSGSGSGGSAGGSGGGPGGGAAGGGPSGSGSGGAPPGGGAGGGGPPTT
jgi:membrane peptidoglycan carboxypeptidase